MYIVRKLIKWFLVLAAFAAGLWKLLIGCKHVRFISDLSEFPPKRKLKKG
jgi:hypothetical protein